MLEAAGVRLTDHVDEVNALNVYPVPDGDTGTNMLHTMSGALAEARRTEPSVERVAAAAAHGALMGARGNSGVILSQILRGLKDATAGRPLLDTEALRAAFAAARAHAFTAVTAPAPGTMLTALEVMERAAHDAAGDADDVLRSAVRAGADAVEATREQNPTNRAAGVIDAGARGLWLLLDGALSAVDGHADETSRRVTVPRVTAVASEVSSWAGAYDVQFLVASPKRTADDLRADMLEFGADCVLVVGDESVVKVHVHTQQPDQILRLGLTAGRIADVVIEDLDAMSEEHERATGIAVRPPAELALVTVVPGEGFAAVARGLGAIALRGGATMNPSTEELLAAIRSGGAARTIVLPNDRNVILAARAAASLAKGVTVIPTENVAQGMAALVAFEADRDPDEVVARMEDCARGSHCLEVTRAVRDTRVDGHDVRAGQAMALVDGRVAAAGDDELAALASGAHLLHDPEILTLYVGEGAADRADLAKERLEAACPGVRVEIIDGGQQHYPFIVQAE